MKRYLEFARFLVGGALNTALTYVLYLGLLRLTPYLWAYTVTYAVGIVVALFVNARFVFRTRLSTRSVVLFPLVYLVQYLVGAGCVVLAVRTFGVPESIAPLIAIAVTIPLTFVLSRSILRERAAPAPAGNGAT